LTHEKTITGGKLISVDLKIAGFNIDDHKLAMIVIFNLRAYRARTNLVATARKFFFAVTWRSSFHIVTLRVCMNYIRF